MSKVPKSRMIVYKPRDPLTGEGLKKFADEEQIKNAKEKAIRWAVEKALEEPDFASVVGEPVFSVGDGQLIPADQEIVYVTVSFHGERMKEREIAEVAT